MNSRISQMIPGAASTTQNALDCWPSGRRFGSSVRAGVGLVGGGGDLGGAMLMLDPVADDEPGLLPERVRVHRKLQVTPAAAEVGREHGGGHQAWRQDLLLDQALGREG